MSISVCSSKGIWIIVLNVSSLMTTCPGILPPSTAVWTFVFKAWCQVPQEETFATKQTSLTIHFLLYDIDQNFNHAILTPEVRRVILDNVGLLLPGFQFGKLASNIALLLLVSDELRLVTLSLCAIEGRLKISINGVPSRQVPVSERSRYQNFFTAVNSDCCVKLQNNYA